MLLEYDVRRTLELREHADGFFDALFRIVIPQAPEIEARELLYKRNGNLVGPELAKRKFKVREQVGLAEQIGRGRKALLSILLPDHYRDFPELAGEPVTSVLAIVFPEYGSGENRDLQVMGSRVV